MHLIDIKLIDISKKSVIYGKLMYIVGALITEGLIMYNIAICDSDKVCLKEIKFLVERFLHGHGPEFSVYECNSLSNVEELMKENVFGLLILDNNLFENGRSAVDFAADLNDRRFGPDVILLTDDETDWTNGYDCGALSYIIKPCEPEKLRSAVLYSAKRHIHLDYSTVIKDTEGKRYFINGKDIVYIEIINKDLFINIANGKVIHSRRTIADLSICEKFPFIRCHNSFYVNMDYVKEFSRYVITLSGGVAIPISKLKYKEFVKKYEPYTTKCFAAAK